MKFNTRVKYNNAYHNALEPFEVEEADVQELQRMGGVLIAETTNEDPKAPENPKKRGKKKAAGDGG